MGKGQRGDWDEASPGPNSGNAADYPESWSISVNVFRSTYHSVPPFAATARRAAVVFARSCGFDGVDLAAIETAVGEAIVNAIEHGNPIYGCFQMSCTFDGATLMLEIKDGGSGFSPDAACRQGEAPRFGGWGIGLMQALMDRVSYDDRVSLVRLEKRLRPRVPREEPVAAGLR